MTTFANQSIGSFDDNSHEYVEIWFDETKVKAFSFHSVGFHDVMKAYQRVHGISVEARFVFTATKGFSCVTNMRGISPDGSDFYVTWTFNTINQDEEFHIGDKHGPVIARMRRTGYIQPERR